MQNSIRYRGYVYDRETGLYYLQSRYYDPETGRFLNADAWEFIGANGTDNSYNAFAYCENNPVNSWDPFGTTTYMFVYDKKGKDFKSQADWMKKKYFSKKTVIIFYIHEWTLFYKKWNSLKKKKVDDIFLFLHGYSGGLSFNGKTISTNKIKNDLQSINNISGKIYLLSCNGGSKNSDYESVAGTFAKKQKGIVVRAVVNGSVYYRDWNQLFSMKPLTKEKNAYWADFRYCKYGGKLVLMENSIGKKWYYG